MRYLFILALAVAGLFGASTGASYAQASRTWVSGVGDDVNPCSRTAPCKTFAGAISKTAAQGQIDVLDPGGFGAVTITKSITIRSEVEAGVSAAGTNGIIINAAATDKVVLDGLDIDGFNTGFDGVKILAGAQVAIIRCSIRRFTGNGVNLVSSTAGSRVVIKDSIINLNNGGLNVKGNGVANVALVFNSMFDTNTTFAMQADGASNALGAVNSYFAGSPTGLSLLNGASAGSVGPSNFLAGAGTFTATNPFK